MTITNLTINGLDCIGCTYRPFFGFATDYYTLENSSIQNVNTRYLSKSLPLIGITDCNAYIQIFSMTLTSPTTTDLILINNSFFNSINGINGAILYLTIKESLMGSFSTNLQILNSNFLLIYSFSGAAVI